MFNPDVQFSTLQEGVFTKDRVKLVRVVGTWLDQSFQATMLHSQFYFDQVKNLFHLQAQVREGIGKTWRWRMRNHRWGKPVRSKKPDEWGAVRAVKACIH